MKNSQAIPFTGLQFYLANANNTVHAIATVDHEVSQDHFRSLVSSVLTAAPQLLSQEDAKAGVYRPAESLQQAIQNSSVDRFFSQDQADTALDELLATPLTNTGKAAFRARCQVIETLGKTTKSRLVFHASHGIMEGGDVANILRGRLETRASRPVDDARMAPPARIASSAVVPFMWLAHLIMARTEKRDAHDFGFVRYVLNRDNLKSICHHLSVSQRALVFAIASEAYRRKRRPNKSVNTLYSTLPATRSRLIDDEYLNVRTDEVTFKHEPDLKRYVRHVDMAIADRGASPMFFATCERKLLRIHMAVYARLPWIYPKAFFGFSPQHLILSMIPPIGTARIGDILKGARVEAGSNTATATSCVFVPNPSSVTMTFWTDIKEDVLHAEIDRIMQELETSMAHGQAAPPI